MGSPSAHVHTHRHRRIVKHTHIDSYIATEIDTHTHTLTRALLHK
jgi:hypothetical protein